MEKNIKHIPLVLFCLYFVKHLIVPITATDVIGLALLAGLTGFFHYLSDKKIKDTVNDELVAIKKELAAARKIQDDIISGVSQLKISHGLKNIQTR